MKVLGVVPAVASRYGGPSEAALRFSRALRSRGADSLLLTTDADGPSRLPVTIGVPIEYAGARTLFFPRQWSEAFKYSAPLRNWLEAHVGDYDVVHIDALFSHSSLAAARACRRRGVPYIVRPIGSLSRWGLTRKPVRKAFVWHFGVKPMLRGAAAIHYTSEIERTEAQAVFPGKSGIVVPLGIPEELLVPSNGAAFRKAFPELGESPYVLVLSRLDPVKGIDVLLDAFLQPTVAERYREWRLVLGGDGGTRYGARLRDSVRRRGGEKQIVFAGWLNGELKHSALYGTSLLALTSRHESFGLCAIEGMACARPVLLSEHVGVSPVVRSAGAGWVTSLAPASLGLALQEALGNPERREAFGAAGRRLVETEYTWNAVANRLLAEYEAIRSRRGAAI